MYYNNHLVKRLRAASVERSSDCFLTIPQTGIERSFGDFFANAEKTASLFDFHLASSPATVLQCKHQKHRRC